MALDILARPSKVAGVKTQDRVLPGGLDAMQAVLPPSQLAVQAGDADYVVGVRR